MQGLQVSRSLCKAAESRAPVNRTGRPLLEAYTRVFHTSPCTIRPDNRTGSRIKGPYININTLKDDLNKDKENNPLDIDENVPILVKWVWPYDTTKSVYSGADNA